MSNDDTAAAADDLMPPVDFIAIEFGPGADLDAALGLVLELVDAGTIAVLDLEFVTKAPDGTIALLHRSAVAEDTGADLAEWDGACSSLLDDDDALVVGEQLAPGSIAAVVVFENLWVTDLGARCRAHGGRLVADGAVPADDLVAALDRVESR